MELEGTTVTYVEGTTLVLLYLGKESSQFPKLIQNLIVTERDRDPELQNVQLIPIQSSRLSQIERWSQVMSFEVIQQWRTFSSDETSTSSLLQDLGFNQIDGTYPIAEDYRKAGQQRTFKQILDDRIEDLYTQQRTQKLVGSPLAHWIELQAQHLENWFIPNLDKSVAENIPALLNYGEQLQLYAQDQFTKSLQKLTIALVQIRRLGSQAALQQLSHLIQAFQEIRTDCVLQYQDQLKRGTSAQKAYRNLVSQIREQRGKQRERDLRWEGALRALRLIYTAQLEANIYQSLDELLGELIQYNQHLSDLIAQTDSFLAQTQSSPQDHSSTPAPLSPLLKDMLLEQIHAAELLRQMERVVGAPIHQWGEITSITPAEVRAELLKLLHPICVNFYMECLIAISLEIDQNNLGHPLPAS